MTSEIVNIKNIDKLPKNSVLAYGHFTTIHAGHIRYLRHAKKLGSNLIVALLGDDKRIGDKKYAFKQNERAEALSLLSIADYIVLMENINLKFLSEKLYPKVLVLGIELFSFSGVLDSKNVSIPFIAALFLVMPLKLM